MNGSAGSCAVMPSLNSHLCAVYVLDGHVVIVNRNETTIAVKLVSNFGLALHSGLILVCTTTLLFMSLNAWAVGHLSLIFLS